MHFSAITSRRNDLLREMFYLLRHRDAAGGLIQEDERDEDDEDSELQTFMLTLDLEKQ